MTDSPPAGYGPATDVVLDRIATALATLAPPWVEDFGPDEVPLALLSVFGFGGPAAGLLDDLTRRVHAVSFGLVDLRPADLAGFVTPHKEAGALPVLVLHPRGDRRALVGPFVPPVLWDPPLDQ